MADRRLLALLGVIGLGIAVIAATLLVLAFNLHALLRQLRAMLPAYARAGREACRAARTGRRMMLAAAKTVRELRQVVHEACQTAWEGLESIHGLGLGNGARGGPRRRYRG